jgi:hypothetical protein
MSIDGSDIPFLNPREVIEDGLPNLLVGKPGTETAATGSLRDVFTGPVNHWEAFSDEVSRFYGTEVLHLAFDRCKDIGTAIDLESIRHKWPNFASLEHTLIAEERDLHGRFLNNAMDPVHAVVKTLQDSRSDSNVEQEKLKAVLPEDLGFGSSKIVPVLDRESNEPDVVVRIPAKDGKVRVVGELKYFFTCSISGAWHQDDALQSQERYSLRHILGKSPEAFYCILLC